MVLPASRNDTDYKLAKGAFIAASFAELKEACIAEAHCAINEAETLAVEHEGLVVVGIFPTGGNWVGTADAVLRLQSSWVGGRISYLLTSAAPFLGQRDNFSQIVFANPRGRARGWPGQGHSKNKGKGGKKERGSSAKSGLQPLEVQDLRSDLDHSCFLSCAGRPGPLRLFIRRFTTLRISCGFSINCLVGLGPHMPSTPPF